MTCKNIDQKVDETKFAEHWKEIFGNEPVTNVMGTYKLDPETNRVVKVETKIKTDADLQPVVEAVRRIEPVTLKRGKDADRVADPAGK